MQLMLRLEGSTVSLAIDALHHATHEKKGLIGKAARDPAAAECCA